MATFVPFVPDTGVRRQAARRHDRAARSAACARRPDLAAGRRAACRCDLGVACRSSRRAVRRSRCSRPALGTCRLLPLAMRRCRRCPACDDRRAVAAAVRPCAAVMRRLPGLPTFYLAPVTTDPLPWPRTMSLPPATPSSTSAPHSSACCSTTGSRCRRLAAVRADRARDDRHRQRGGGRGVADSGALRGHRPHAARARPCRPPRGRRDRSASPPPAAPRRSPSMRPARCRCRPATCSSTWQAPQPVLAHYEAAPRHTRRSRHQHAPRRAADAFPRRSRAATCSCSTARAGSPTGRRSSTPASPTCIPTAASSRWSTGSRRSRPMLQDLRAATGAGCGAHFAGWSFNDFPLDLADEEASMFSRLVADMRGGDGARFLMDRYLVFRADAPTDTIQRIVVILLTLGVDVLLVLSVLDALDIDDRGYLALGMIGMLGGLAASTDRHRAAADQDGGEGRRQQGAGRAVQRDRARHRAARPPPGALRRQRVLAPAREPAAVRAVDLPRERRQLAPEVPGRAAQRPTRSATA